MAIFSLAQEDGSEGGGSREEKEDRGERKMATEAAFGQK